MCNKILHVGLVSAMVTTENYAVNALQAMGNVMNGQVLSIMSFVSMCPMQHQHHGMNAVI